ncbi:MAG: hypothetical protein LAO09_04430 [Acidobacteriia bacterium]|nr:hypothetical protein [Terriglobia bacterium]
MDETLQLCTICGEEKAAGQIWFLIAESHWEDTLKVFQWNDEIARRKGIYHACCPAHAEELVIHWMTTGSLDFPFATTVEALSTYPWGTSTTLRVVLEPDTRGARQLGELAVHRDSIRRVLTESPDSLQVILDELCAALRRESRPSTARLESGDDIHLSLLRQA